jgi:hypothetical protein
VFPSIRLKEDVVVHPASISAKPTRSPAAAEPSPNHPAAAVSPDNSAPTLADLARRARQAPRPKAVLDNAEGASPAPAGFQALSFRYCLNPDQCREASAIIPANAETISTVNGQHIFRSVLPGEIPQGNLPQRNVVMLYAGPADVNAPYRSLTDPDYIRIRDLANSNGWSREKPADVSTQELTIDEKPALVTRFRFQREKQTWWVGERALIENRGAQFLVGCAASEEHFADAEAICTTLLKSLRLP